MGKKKLPTAIKKAILEMAASLPALEWENIPVGYMRKGHTLDLEFDNDGKKISKNTRYIMGNPKDEDGKEIQHCLEVNHFKYMKKLYFKHGWKGVFQYIDEVKERFMKVKEPTNEKPEGKRGSGKGVRKNEKGKS